MGASPEVPGMPPMPAIGAQGVAGEVPTPAFVAQVAAMGAPALPPIPSFGVRAPAGEEGKGTVDGKPSTSGAESEAGSCRREHPCYRRVRAAFARVELDAKGGAAVAAPSCGR